MLKLTIVTPERKMVYNLEITEVTVPAHMGELNILNGHAPLITTLEPGVIKWKSKDADITEMAAISWGYCQVSPEAVNVLAEVAHFSDDIDEGEFNNKLKDLEMKLASETLTDIEWTDLKHEIGRVRAGLDLLKKKH